MTGMFLALLGGKVQIVSDPYFEYTTLLLPGNGTNGAQNNTFLDSSTNNFTITRNGNTTQGTFSPFSQTGWGNYFNGSSYLSAGTTLFNYTTGNASTTTFTIEAFIYLNSYQTTATIYYNPCIISKGDVFLNLGVNGSGNLIFYHYDGTVRSITGSSVIPLATWTYVAVTVTGGTATLYVNGTSVGSGTWYGIQAAGQNTTSLIGRASTNASSLYINGYISNLRVSTVARTIATPTTAYTNDANTALLTAQSNRFIDNSSSPITLTVTGSPTVVAFSPFNPTASWSAATYGGSGYFDGSGDWLSAPANTAFDLGTSDFTIEGWFYYSENPPATYDYLWAIGGNNTNGIGLYVDNKVPKIWNGSNVLTTTGSVPGFAWTHIAAVRSSGTLVVYQNGTSIGSVSFTSNLTGGATAGPKLGRWDGVDVQDYFGYVNGFRIIKGTAVYTGNFTPPSLAPLTNAGSTSAASYPSTTNVNTSFASSATSLLLNFTNAGIYDATSKNDLETVGNAQISTAVSAQWGTGSIYMAAATANTDYLVTPASRNVQLGSGDFTIEFWMRPDSVTTSWANSSLATMLDLDPSAGTGTDWWFIHQLNNTLQFGTNGAVILTSSASLVATTWQYIALVRSGSGSNNLTFYINGSSSGSATYTSTIGGNRRLFIGTQQGSTRWYKGYIQDLRITPGVARVITTPTAAFPTL